MANETRLRSAFVEGTLTAGVDADDTSLSSAAFALLPAVGGSEHLALVLDPAADPAGGTPPEIVWVTAHTAASDTVTVARGQEATTGRSHASGTAVVHGPTPFDAGSTAVVRSAVALGTMPASAGAFTWVELADICRRGLVSLLTITPAVAGLYDVAVRSAGAGGGTLFLQAIDADGTYEISTPWYVEGDADSSIWLGIRNQIASTRAFTLTSLRLERFA